MPRQLTLKSQLRQTNQNTKQSSNTQGGILDGNRLGDQMCQRQHLGRMSPSQSNPNRRPGQHARHDRTQTAGCGYVGTHLRFNDACGYTLAKKCDKSTCTSLAASRRATSCLPWGSDQREMLSAHSFRHPATCEMLGTQPFEAHTHANA